MDVLLWRQLRGTRISARYLLDLFGVEYPPVPVFGIAKGLGVEVYFREYIDSAGFLGISNNGEVARIFVRRSDPETRQRFTVAHELGHLVLHREQNIHRDTSYEIYETYAERRRETEANRFAAELLMPGWMVDHAIGRMGLNDSQLGELFNVSRDAIYYRLKDLGYLKTY